MKNDNLSEEYQVLAQSETPTADTNKVAQKNEVKQQPSSEIQYLVSTEDFEKDLSQFTEREITVHNGSEWVDPTSEFFKQKVTASLTKNKSVSIIPIKYSGYPAVMEMRCQVIDSKLDIDVHLGEEILDIPKVIAMTIGEYDFSELIAEFEKYNRKFLIEGEERFILKNELVEMANELLEHLLKDENLHLPGSITINSMTEKGREMQGGFMAMRTIDGVSLSFMYFGATGDDVPFVE